MDKASYSTSNSGSETSTDISTSSLENLSTSARQEPQGEETADLAPGLLDACAVSASSSSSLSSVDDVDAKSGGMWQCDATSNDSRVASVTAGQQTSHSQQQNPTQLSTSLAQPPPSNVAVDCRPVVSAGAANSLIRQLLQNSPQYSHLLSDLEPAYAGGGGGGGSVGGLEVKPAGSSPKSALRGGAGRLDGRILPDTPPTVTSSSSRTGVSTYGGSQTAAAINRRLVNRYVNVDGDSGRSATQQRASYRDRQRPSTAPSSDHPPPPPPPTAAALPPVTRVQTVADPVERRRSFEVVDRVTGATLPRPSAASKTADPLRKQSTTTKPTGLAQQHHHHQPHERQQQLQTASPQHLQSCGSSQQHHQQQRATGIPQSHQQEQQTAPPTTTTTTTSSSSSLCVEQQCAPGDNQRSSPQTVW